MKICGVIIIYRLYVFKIIFQKKIFVNKKNLKVRILKHNFFKADRH